MRTNVRKQQSTARLPHVRSCYIIRVARDGALGAVAARPHGEVPLQLPRAGAAAGGVELQGGGRTTPLRIASPSLAVPAELLGVDIGAAVIVPLALPRLCGNKYITVGALCMPILIILHPPQRRPQCEFRGVRFAEEGDDLATLLLLAVTCIEGNAIAPVAERQIELQQSFGPALADRDVRNAVGARRAVVKNRRARPLLNITAGDEG